MEGTAQIRALIARVRARWRRLAVLEQALRTGLLVAGVLAIALLAASWTGQWPLVLGFVGMLAVALVAVAVFRGVRAVGAPPSDTRVARYIEESEPRLDDRLVSAVDLLGVQADDRPRLAPALIADAGRKAETVDPAAVIAAARLRRAAALAAGVAVLIAAIAFFGRDVVRQSRDALSLALFPSRVTLEVLPGSTRLRAGESLTIRARLVGNRAPVDVRVLRAPKGTADASPDAGGWEALPMYPDGEGGYSLGLDALTEAFRYRVLAGAVASPVFDVAVTRPPRVERIDIDYTYPRALALEPRTDVDGGDIYAPAGTSVRLRVAVSGDASAGRLTLDDGTAVDLAPGPSTLAGAFTVDRDGTYKVALADADGVEHIASSEYFIRVLNDRPPDVRVLRPARDREVTPLEEVEIQAEATDDFGIARLELVYAVGGGPERVVRLDVPPRATSVTAGHMLYLEDLKVQPGDFVTYFVRARDVGRAARSTEARSDLFFLEVRPFDQQFRMADTQASGTSGRARSLDDLVAAQKEIIVATFKLDRRAEAAGDPAPRGDVLAVARAESELRQRVEETTSGLRTTSLRDPRRPGAPGGRTGIAQPGESPLTEAVAALTRAVEALERLDTAGALPAEMEALDRLLEAQAEVQERQVTRQQAGTGGGNRANRDLSGLFDRELQRQQHTNYENRQTAEPQAESGAEDALERVRDLAQRQDELLRQQRELDRTRAQMTEAERQRALERLTREQNQLRQQAEQLARELGQSGQADQAAQAGQTGDQGQTGVPTRSGQSGQRGQSGEPRPGQSGQTGQTGQQAGQSDAGQGRTADDGRDGRSLSPGERLRAAAESMRDAADGMRRAEAGSAERAARALNELRQAERELQAGTPEGQQRALGNLQFEARELAEAQRALGSAEGSRGAGGDRAGGDQARRAAGDQARLAERLSRLQQQLEQQAVAGAPGGQTGSEMRDAAREAAAEIERQRLVERMQQAADQLRGSAQGARGAQPGTNPADTRRASQEIARALDSLADRLAAASASSDAESRRLSSQLARAQDLRERMAETTKELERLDREARETGAAGGTAGAATQEIERQIEQARALLEELRREDPGLTPGGMGFTFEGQGMVRSAPGTEAFKQDLSRWEELRRQITQTLDRAESAVSARLRARQSQDRLAAGLDDRAPAGYQQHVDSYFKALADRPSR